MKPERWGRIESIFHKALEAEESRRAAVLEEFCAGDEDLRREVESLLVHHTEAGSFIEKPAFADASASPLRPHNSRSISPESDLAETAIGHYRVLGKIGGGAPLWMYLAAVSFIGYFVLLVHNNFFGPPEVGFSAKYEAECTVLTEVAPGTPAARAGLRPSDHLLAVDGQPVR